ncbi:MAG: hypothetical protein Q6353_019985 [Candidatus Sigynarchaeum springense]
MNPAKKRDPGSVAKCLEIADPLERDKCIIQRLEQRIDNSVKGFETSLNEMANDLKREFKEDLRKKIDDEVLPLLKSADENAIGAIGSYSGMVNTVFRLGQDIDVLKNDIAAIKRDMVTKEDSKQFATKDDLKQFATKDDLKRIDEKIDKLLDGT